MRLRDSTQTIRSWSDEGTARPLQDLSARILQGATDGISCAGQRVQQGTQPATEGVAMMKKLYAFIMGMIEFRQNATTAFEESLIEAYDAGRELAHKLTLRIYEGDK
jgi:hypothetical protein